MMGLSGIMFTVSFDVFIVGDYTRQCRGILQIPNAFHELICEYFLELSLPEPSSGKNLHAVSSLD